MLNLTESQEKRCQELMTETVKDMVKGKSRDIIRTVNEIYDDSEAGNASLDVPIVLRVKYDEDNGYSFGGNIEIKKITKIKETRDPVTYNPQLPDLPGFEDGNMPEGKGDNGQTFFFMKDWNCTIIDNTTEFEIDGWINIGKPVNQGKLVNAPLRSGFEYRILRGDFDGEICYQLQKKKIEESKPEKPESTTEPAPEQTEAAPVDVKPTETPAATPEEPAAEKSDAPTEQPTETPAEKTEAAPPISAAIGDQGKDFVFKDGTVVRAFDFGKLPENGKYFLNENEMLHKEKKTEDEILKMALIVPAINYTVIRGYDKESQTTKYYLCRKKEAKATKPETTDESKEDFKLCDQESADGRKCQRAAGHDGKHFYGKKQG